jgi:4-aminobutyrate aminotransferase-like enzyme
LEKGLVPRIYSDRRHDRLAFAPPLIITEEEADRELDILYAVLAGLKDLKIK